VDLVATVRSTTEFAVAAPTSISQLRESLGVSRLSAGRIDVERYRDCAEDTRRPCPAVVKPSNPRRLGRALKSRYIGLLGNIALSLPAIER
jgi:hypothetical protein